MDALTLFDKILSSKYPILALAAIITFYTIKGIKANWPGLIKFIDRTVDRWFTDKEQQIEIQVELDIQIKSLIATNTALQEQIKELITQNRTAQELNKELSHKQDMIAEGFWDVRKTQDAYFRKADVIWKEIGIIPKEITP
jgi:hypothetical protein